MELQGQGVTKEGQPAPHPHPAAVGTAARTSFPAMPCVCRATLQTNTYILALCFQSFDPSNLFVLVFVGLIVKVYDNSLLVNPIWLSLDIPVEHQI